MRVYIYTVYIYSQEAGVSKEIILRCETVIQYNRCNILKKQNN